MNESLSEARSKTNRNISQDIGNMRLQVLASGLLSTTAFIGLAANLIGSDISPRLYFSFLIGFLFIWSPVLAVRGSLTRLESYLRN